MKNILKIFLLLLFTITLSSFAQNKYESLKRQAIYLMKEGRFGEAVDQLNKYIAANPREAYGYHQRGLCFENRLQYQSSVLDLRRAIRLDPANNEIKKDLDRIIATWHRELYLKIDGHKRDIAIDPNKAFSYLEIGKSYRWLEEWENAEIWYDQYLKRDNNASPDEIIRYTEILAKTGSITKGEKILKIFVGRYPDDWRLWSRYGYFTLWLGKVKIAENAFTTSLGFKPFFKEAQDGLDEAKRVGYLTQYQGRAFERVYPIDKHYRILTVEPDNDEIRFTLANELISADRYEEAYQQLQYLQPKYLEDQQFKSLWKTVTEHRDSTFNKNIELNTGKLKENPKDKEAVLNLANAYGNLFYYDNAIEVLSEYLKDIPEDQDLDARFRYAQFCAWNYEWEKAIAQVEKLLELDPNNLDYQQLRGQIGVWTVNDLDLAEKYLLNVYEVRSKDLNVLTALTSLYAWKKNFTEAKKYLTIAQTVAPRSPEVESAVSNYELHVTANEEAKVFAMKGEAGKLVSEGKCDEALEVYDQYKTKRTGLTRDEMIEYADIASCAKKYSIAIETYDKLLTDQFDYRLALQRAKNYYYNKDSVKAVQELESLSKLNSEDDEALLFLADGYVQTNQLTKAEEIYRSLKLKAKDETQSNLLDQRMIYLGEYYIKNKDYAKANSIFEEIQKILKNQSVEKDLAQRRIYMADSYIKDKNYDEANKLFDKLNESVADNDLKKDLIQRQLFLGSALLEDRKLDEAEDVFSKLTETIKDAELRKDLDQRRLMLGDAYVTTERYGRAKSVYDDILDSTQDTSQIRIVKERIGWLPPSGFSRGIYNIGSFFSFFLPTNIGVSPFSAYYKDNQKFHLLNYGVRLDAGFIGFLGLGASWSRANLDNGSLQKDFTQIKGVGTIRLSQYLSLFGSYGLLQVNGEPNRKIGDGGIRFEKPEEFSAAFSYENNDARMILYSPYLIPIRLGAKMYRLAGFYNFNNLIRISSSYNYFQVSDDNEGNDFQIRLGRNFFKNGMFGYEYYFSDYKLISSYYYSPQNFESHSIWTEWNWTFDKVKTKIGGKLGYVPAVDFVISEIFGEAVYNPIMSLVITCRLSFGNSFRYDSSYKNISASLFAYWGIY